MPNTKPVKKSSSNEKEEEKIPAAAVGVDNDRLFCKPDVGSLKKIIFPVPRGRLSKQEIMIACRPVGWYLNSVVVPGGVELIMISKENMTEDAYLQDLTEAIENKTHPDLNKLGIIGKFSRRVSLEDSRPLQNRSNRSRKQNNFARRAFVRVLDAEEADPVSRLESLRVIQTFFASRPNSKIFIEQPGWDLTDYDKPLKIDNFLIFSEIVRLLKGMFNCGENWAVKNWDAAQLFFTEGHIPYEAHEDLGVPEDKVMRCNPIDLM
jgi:hypothetical protein